MDLTHLPNVITAFTLFVHKWYLLNTIDVVLLTLYVMVRMVAARMSVLMS